MAGVDVLLVARMAGTSVAMTQVAITAHEQSTTRQ